MHKIIFYNSTMLCLRVITSQMFCDIISALKCHRVPGRHIIPGVTMTERACSSFTIKNDNGPEVCSLVNSLRGISEYCSVILTLLSLYSPCIARVEVLFELKQSTGKYSVNCKIESFVELVVI